MSCDADLVLRFGETKLAIVADLTATIEAAGFTDSSDIVEATFMVKLDPTAPDVDAQYTGTLTGGQIDIDPVTNIATFLITDYSQLAVDVVYTFAIGLQFTGDTTFRELLKRNSDGRVLETIGFAQDVIRA